MQKIFSFFLFLLICQSSFADTTWLSRKWKKTVKDSSAFYSLYFKNGSSWNQQIFFSQNKRLYMDGFFTDSSSTIKTGKFRWYNEEGLMTDSAVYQKGVALYRCIFHENGQKKTVLLHDSNNVAIYVNSWDQFGNESYRDTFYRDMRGRDCHKDTAFGKGIIDREDSLWRLRFYHTYNDSLYTTGYFKERLCKTRVKYGSWYHRGLLRDSLLFDNNGKRNAGWYFHKNGNKNAYREYDSLGRIIIAKNWDENGNEIKVDTSLKHAMPVDGFKNWQKNILRKINTDKTLDWKYRKNLYGSVFISFIIDESGHLMRTFIKESSLYPEMDSIILNACRENQLWKPCTFHGRKATFFGVHSFSFVAGKVIKYKTLY